MHRLKQIYVLGLIGLISLPGIAAAASTLTPQSLFQQVDAEGAKAVVERLMREKISVLYTSPSGEGVDPYPDSENWRYLMKQIRKGDAAWLEVARVLRLDVAPALPNNPAGVLRLLTNSHYALDVGEVCAPPPNNAYASEATAKLDRDFLRRAEAALLKLKAPLLVNQRLACLENLQMHVCRLTDCKTPPSRQYRSGWIQVPAPTDAALTAELLLHDIKTHGPDAVLTRLWRNNQGHDWRVVLGNIEKGNDAWQGNDAWIDVAHQLWEAAVALDLSQQMANALARALPRAPLLILRFIRHSNLPMDLRASSSEYVSHPICGTWPYSDGNEDVANQQFVRAAEAALPEVKERDLERVKEICGYGLQNLKRHLPEAKK